MLCIRLKPKMHFKNMHVQDSGIDLRNPKKMKKKPLKVVHEFFQMSTNLNFWYIFCLVFGKGT